MKVAGIWSGHDCSFCILENGKPMVHAELERYIREKEPAGDAATFMLDTCGQDKCKDIVHVATCCPDNKMKQYQDSYNKINNIVSANGGEVHVVGHHRAHAANAFFSSNFNKALIVTLDGGGQEDTARGTTACTYWTGDENKISHVHTYPLHAICIGGVWTRVTRYVFKLQSGWPLGHQAGSVMAMAALGDATKYKTHFMTMLTSHLHAASHKPATQPRGAYTGNDPPHPYLDPWAELAAKSEQNKFDIAAGLQAATEELIKSLLSMAFKKVGNLEYLCLAGGVVLNCVATGKIKSWFPHIKDIYVPPTPGDEGLPLGASQYVWHHKLGNARIKWEDNLTPYLGCTYTEKDIRGALEVRKDEINISNASIDDVIDLLDKQNIVAVFSQGSESGRRALGNRSILADPRSKNMKDIINNKVKHRQWYRPFAPSILRSEVSNWFTDDKNSPYMSFVLTFKDDMKDKVPAVLHFNGTARLQTVTENDNKWYHNFLTRWHAKSGVPIILNTSFNDREPICELPEHAINCYLKTNIDYLYFVDCNLLISKK
tara:strand:+ start:6491 stop:8125 length:1635 start_codon:yes stop_codon:yes gene_type:complete